MAILMNDVSEYNNHKRSDPRLVQLSMLFLVVINSKLHYSGEYKREKPQIQTSSGHCPVL